MGCVFRIEYSNNDTPINERIIFKRDQKRIKKKNLKYFFDKWKVWNWKYITYLQPVIKI